jgi:predicted alpha/beta hydrolase family esterase
MKKIYLIHGWGGSSKSEGWFKWLKEELGGKAELHILDMPDTDSPKINAWVGFLEKNIKEINTETYFIGHSIGCQAIMRFLEKLPKGKKVGGCVFIAGWFNLKEETYENEEERKISKPWIETPINTEKVKEHADKFLAIFSDNDPYVPLSNSKIFKNKLGAKIVIKKNHEHFNQVSEVPEILDFLL